MQKMPPTSVPHGVPRYFLLRESRSIEGVARRRVGISATFGMREKRLTPQLSHMPWEVERVGGNDKDRPGGAVR